MKIIFLLKNILILSFTIGFIDLDDCSSIKEHTASLFKINKDKIFGNNLNNDSLLDTSIFDNTYETFFEFANRRTFEIESRNKDLYEKSMKACIYTPYENDNDESDTTSNNQQCLVSVLNMAEHHGGGSGGRMSDRLFQFDAKTLGLISSSDSSLRLFDFNATHGILQSVRVKYFKNERPYDACADTVNSNVYAVFPDENKIGK